MGFFKEISRNFSFSKGGDVNEVVIAGSWRQAITPIPKSAKASQSQEFERAPSAVALLGAQSRVANNGITYPALTCRTISRRPAGLFTAEGGGDCLPGTDVPGY